MKLSLSQKMIVQILPAVLLVFVTLTIISIIMSGIAEQNLAYDAATQMAANYANDFNTKISADQSIGKTMSLAMAGYPGKSHAINGVARGAQEQASAIAKASQMATRINQAIEQVTNNAQTVTHDSAEAAKYSREGARTVSETIAGMETIRSKVGFSAAKVEEMGARSEEIGAIVETIEDIASQTNLLALNAVIAMKESALEVEAGVSKANTSWEVLNNILGAAESVYKQAEEAGGAAARVSAAANELVNAVDSVSAVIEENTAATEEMSASSDDLTHAIENIANVSAENSASAQEVWGATNQVSSQVNQVSSAAANLMKLAQQLQAVGEI